jgi:hypothetical protein
MSKFGFMDGRISTTEDTENTENTEVLVRNL